MEVVLNEEYISKREAKELLERRSTQYNDGGRLVVEDCIKVIEEMNGVKVDEVGTLVPTGRWIDDKPGVPDWHWRDKGNNAYHCSRCGHKAGTNKHKTYKFCPWCGADMRSSV